MDDHARHFTVGPADEGGRLDAFLARRLECSRARARELMDADHVTVDDRLAGSKHKGIKLEVGAEVRVAVAPETLDRLRAVTDGPLTILAEGAGWVALDKPAGLAVHPLRAAENDTLLQRLVARRPEIEGVGEGALRSGVVHRLDVDTSGCQLFATDGVTHERLRRAFREHTIDKVYRALVVGCPPEHGDTTLDLVVARHRPARVRAYEAGTGPDGSRTCGTRWRVLATFEGASLVEVRPRTGFLHQVRVTLAHHGHPLLGDRLYGDGSGAARHMLHACALRFDEIDVTAPDPPDFAACLDALAAGGTA